MSHILAIVLLGTWALWLVFMGVTTWREDRRAQPYRRVAVPLLLRRPGALSLFLGGRCDAGRGR